MQFLKLALKIVGCGGIAIAIIALAFSFSTYRHTHSFMQIASRTQGTVVRFDEKRDLCPVVRFQDAKGQGHEVESSISQNPPAYKVGDKVTVLYQPDKPENAKVNTFFDIWGWSIMLGGFGVITFAFGAGMLAVAIKIQNENPGPSVRVHPSSNMPQDATLEISFPKALFVTIPSMACFVIGLFAIGIPMHDPLLIGFLAVMVAGMTFVFAGFLCFTLRCKIGRDGLRSAVPTFYQQVLRWEDISVVRGFASPFYVVKGSAFGPFCILPRRFLLKRPESLKELIERYAPADNIVRKKLAVS